MPKKETLPCFFWYLWNFFPGRQRRVRLESGEREHRISGLFYMCSCHPKEKFRVVQWQFHSLLCHSYSSHYFAFDSLEAELYREIRIQMRAKDLLENSVAPIDTSNCRREPQSRTATKTKQERLGFLQDKSFSFKPRINPTIPDFEGLYWAFQREAVRRQEIKEATRNKPFKLRTSNLHGRQRQANEKIKVRWLDISVVLLSPIKIATS